MSRLNSLKKYVYEKRKYIVINSSESDQFLFKYQLCSFNITLSVTLESDVFVCVAPIIPTLDIPQSDIDEFLQLGGKTDLRLIPTLGRNKKSQSMLLLRHDFMVNQDSSDKDCTNFDYFMIHLTHFLCKDLPGYAIYKRILANQ